MNRAIILLLAIFSCMSLSANLLWDDAVPIRQGVNIEWFRTGTDASDGGAVYVWSDTKLGERDLYAQKVLANGTMAWGGGQPLLIDSKIDRQEDPVVTRTSDNNFVIAWIDFSDDLDGNVYAQKVSNTGQLMWQTGGKPVCVQGDIQISLNIEPDNAGGAYIVWEESRNPSKDIYGQHLDANGNPLWTVNGIPIANGDGDESYNTMWADGAGGMIIGYVYGLAGEEDLFVKRFLPNGNMAWTQPLALCNAPAKQNKIKMSPINGDSFVFTWMDERNLDPDIYAQRVDLNGNMLWANPFVVFTDQSSPTPTPQENPRIVQTSDNGVIIVWEDKRNDADDPDLFAQKVSLNGVLQWNTAGMPVAVAEFGQRGPRMDGDDEGGCYIVWDDTRNGNTPNVDIYVQHLSSAGAPIWEVGGRAVCTAPNEQSGSLLKVSNNNIFVNWMDMRTGSVGLNYQVLNMNGVPQLQENGVEVFWGLSGDASTDQIIIMPRQNDIVAVWQDTRFANLGYQIFMQIINADGSVELETNGRPITIQTGEAQLTPAAVVLPDGKICVVWEEKRGDNPKIFGQLLDANGNRLWGDMGIAITDSEPLRQKDPRISCVVEDGGAALYIGWSNLDTVTTPEGPRDFYHIYGQKIVGNNKMWGANGLLISQYSAADVMFECALDKIVDRYFVWTRNSSAPESWGYINVWTKMVNPDGTTAAGWSDYGVATSNYWEYDTLQFNPKTAMTNAGLFIGWSDFRGDFQKTLYGQLVSPTGSLLWNAAGVALADNNHEQDKLAAIGGSTITFAWMESVTASNQEIALQRYTLAGAPMFGDLGSFIVQRDTTQSTPALGRFQTHGMVSAWEDFTTIEPDIYARYIEADGTPDPDYPIGFVVCDMLKKQLGPQIAPLPDTDDAIITWSDGRSSGKTDIFGLYCRRITNDTTANEDNEHAAAARMTLHAAYPNPFNPQTTISFNLKETSAKVDLSIYNAKGQKVSTLHHGLTEKGNYSYVWDGRDVSGKATTTGVYFYRLSSGDKTITRKMVMMK